MFRTLIRFAIAVSIFVNEEFNPQESTEEKDVMVKMVVYDNHN